MSFDRPLRRGFLGVSSSPDAPSSPFLDARQNPYRRSRAITWTGSWGNDPTRSIDEYGTKTSSAFSSIQGIKPLRCGIVPPCLD
jgi:hypothetical protein